MILRAAALALALAAPAAAQTIEAARYAEPTTRYPHAVLGDDVEHAAMEWRLSDGTGRRIALPEELVFEDTAPRLWDLTGDGAPEVVVVESHQRQGARLAVYGIVSGQPTRLSATPFIGTRFRWLAPVGAADLDGDGAMEVAYVDRPHLAKVLRVWRWTDAGLVQVDALEGLTNHRIGEPDIAGGIRDCGTGPEMILADQSWRELRAVRLGFSLSSRRIGPHTGRDSFAAAMACE